MRKIFATGIGILALAAAMQPAAAADMPTKAPRIVVDPWNWTGVYIGLNAGYSWGRSDTHLDYVNIAAVPPVGIVPPPGSITDVKFDLEGWVAGGQIGANWQVSKDWLVGIEGDIQGTGQKGSANFLCAVVPGGGVPGACFPNLTFTPAGLGPQTLSLDQKLKWFATLRGRLGLLFSPSVFGYLTGGLAYGEIETNGTSTAFNLGVPVPVAIAFSHTDWRAGWTIGGGFEGRLWGNWTGKIEYLYMDLGSVSGTIVHPAPINLQVNYRSRITDNILRVGINYKFDSYPTPVAAKY